MLYKTTIGKKKVRTDLSELKKELSLLRSRNEPKKVVFTNGCFDILHLGHIEYLIKASQMGDILVLGVNSDDSIRTLKGLDRPIMNEEQRYHIMASLSFIDMVVPFNDETPYNLIKELKPDILVKGSDYNVKDIVGYDMVKEYGGTTKTIETNLPPEMYSTTNIINKIKTIKD